VFDISGTLCKEHNSKIIPLPSNRPSCICPRREEKVTQNAIISNDTNRYFEKMAANKFKKIYE
jgi:hypothetical protein